MSKSRSSNPSSPSLIISREEAAKKIKEQIRKGRRISGLSTRSRDDTNGMLIEANKWYTFNIEMLTRMFDKPTFANQFKKAATVEMGKNPTWRDEGQAVQSGVWDATIFLESLQERLKLIPEAEASRAAGTPKISSSGASVFVVHGHNNAAKESVARFLEKLGLNAIILHEQPNLNRTIIEKLEGSSDVSFAVVLLTPDDLGFPMGKSDQIKTRARQNVIFELGFFLGKLGRGRVCAIYQGDVELPSDYSGIVYTPLDDAGAWRTELVREFKAAGLPVDLNKLY
jgi:predicted nucleotide-binding protein